MVNRKNCLGILVIVLVFGMMIVGCGSENNPFDKTSWTMSSDSSTLNFYGSTWEWFRHSMNNTSGNLTVYDFKGNYTHSGNVATLTSTHFRTSADWVPFSARWTVTLNGNQISVAYNGTVNSRILLDQVGENREYGRLMR